MDTFKLKVLAIVAMLIDHTGIVLVSRMNQPELYLICRSIGRLAFPIFAFLIVEGFLHTRDVKKYLKRLLVFAAASEIPFDIAFYQYNYNTDMISDITYLFKDSSYFSVVLNRLIDSQNVFFTLFLGLLLITLFDMVEKRFKKTDFMDIVISNSIDAVLTLIVCVAAIVLRTDYAMAGILIIICFYLFRDSIVLMGISVLVISGTMLCELYKYTQTGNFLSIVGILATIAILPIAFYNGKKGKSMKYFFYAFYPVHLICLYLISTFF